MKLRAILEDLKSYEAASILGEQLASELVEKFNLQKLNKKSIRNLLKKMGCESLGS